MALTDQFFSNAHHSFNRGQIFQRKWFSSAGTHTNCGSVERFRRVEVGKPQQTEVAHPTYLWGEFAAPKQKASYVVAGFSSLWCLNQRYWESHWWHGNIVLENMPTHPESIVCQASPGLRPLRREINSKHLGTEWHNAWIYMLTFGGVRYRAVICWSGQSLRQFILILKEWFCS